MSGRGIFSTTLVWQDGDEDFEADVRVTYSRYAGYRGSYYEPPEEASPGSICEALKRPAPPNGAPLPSAARPPSVVA